MGLDVRVYTDIKLIEGDNYDFIAYVIDSRWLDRIKNLKNYGRYIGKRESVSIGYPYSSHNDFRRSLCKMIGKSENDWHETELDEKTPFYEFFEFADNDGCIDWETSGKLYDDFINHKDVAEKHFSNDELGMENYNDWLNIFNCARNKGVVVYS